MKKLKSIIKLLRPKQWLKNVFVLAGIVFANKLLNVDAWIITMGAFFAFCCAASSVYVLNDILDRKADANHPVKCRRPIASGAITISEAIVILVLLIAAALLIPMLLNNLYLMICIVCYMIMMTFYSCYLKHVVIIDVMIIAAGFVLRAIAGALALEIIISPWLVLCTALLALFLGLNKRKGEIEKLGDNGTTRGVLQHYSKQSLSEMLGIITPSIVVAYAIYTFNSPVGPLMMLTLPFVIYGLFRYIYISDKKAHHDAPELALLSDWPLLIDVMLWGLTAAALIIFL